MVGSLSTQMSNEEVFAALVGLGEDPSAGRVEAVRAFVNVQGFRVGSSDQTKRSAVDTMRKQVEALPRMLAGLGYSVELSKSDGDQYVWNVQARHTVFEKAKVYADGKYPNQEQAWAAAFGDALAWGAIRMRSGVAVPQQDVDVLEPKATFVRRITDTLVSCGWQAKDGAAIASRTFDTAVGKKDALVYLADYGGDDGYLLQGEYYSEGRNALEPHNVRISKHNGASTTVDLVRRFSDRAVEIVGKTYAARLLAKSEEEPPEKAASAPFKRTAPEAITLAYVAMGVRQALMLKQESSALESYHGETAFVEAVIEHALTIDRVADWFDARDGHPGVFAYEVAEPFGKAFAGALLEQQSGELSPAVVLKDVMIDAGYALGDVEQAIASLGQHGAQGLTAEAGLRNEALPDVSRESSGHGLRYSPLEVTGGWFDGDVKIPAYTNGLLWNGWEQPYFPRSSVEQLAHLMPGQVTFDALGGVVLVKDEEGEVTHERATHIEVDGVRIEVFSVGSSGWCWEKAGQAVDLDLSRSESDLPDAGATFSVDANPSGETPWKADVHSDTVVRFKDSDGAFLANIFANRAEQTLQIEYAEVREDARGKGVYRRLLQSLSEQFTLVSDMPHNNAAKSVYLELGAREQRDGRLVIDRRTSAKLESNPVAVGGNPEAGCSSDLSM